MTVILLGQNAVTSVVQFEQDSVRLNLDQPQGIGVHISIQFLFKAFNK